MSIIKFNDLDEVIERANRTMYGLAAAVWTRDVSKALAVANGVRAGTVWVSDDVFDSGAPSEPGSGNAEWAAKWANTACNSHRGRDRQP